MSSCINLNSQHIQGEMERHRKTSKPVIVPVLWQHILSIKYSHHLRKFWTRQNIFTEYPNWYHIMLWGMRQVWGSILRVCMILLNSQTTALEWAKFCKLELGLGDFFVSWSQMERKRVKLRVNKFTNLLRPHGPEMATNTAYAFASLPLPTIVRGSWYS